MRAPMLEVCVDSLDGLEAACAGGADRIELCAALSEGGLTPSYGMLVAAAACPVPCYVMIRPRAGGFVFSPSERAAMLEDIAQARALGLAGVVLGAETASGALDLQVLSQQLAACGPMGATLHRVIDCVQDRPAALEQAIDLGFERVLTSGGAPNAVEGQAEIARMVQQAAGRIVVMPGAGLTPETVTAVQRVTGAREFHASCRGASGAGGGHMFDAQPRMDTDAGIVRAMKQALSAGR